VLSACRASEATKASWAEIDLDGKVWTIPGARMKGGKPHRVPLSREAVAILGSIRPASPDPSELIFAVQQEGKPISLTALMKALRRACRTTIP
jgi:integrase